MENGKKSGNDDYRGSESFRAVLQKGIDTEKEDVQRPARQQDHLENGCRVGIG